MFVASVASFIEIMLQRSASKANRGRKIEGSCPTKQNCPDCFLPESEPRAGRDQLASQSYNDMEAARRQ